MANLKTKPFYLNQEQLDWWYNALNSMNVDEKPFGALLFHCLEL